jgi:hypothetical protein
VLIKVGTNRALGTVTPYVGRDKGIFQEHGVNVEIVDFVDFEDGSTLMEAFASRQPLGPPNTTFSNRILKRLHLHAEVKEA